MLEMIIVIAVVAVAAVLVGRWIYQTLAHKRPGCECGQVDCSLADQCDYTACELKEPTSAATPFRPSPRR